MLILRADKRSTGRSKEQEQDYPDNYASPKAGALRGVVVWNLVRVSKNVRHMHSRVHATAANATVHDMMPR